MKYLLTSTAVARLLGISPSFAQDATSTAVGVGIAKSAAQSTAVAVSGQGGGGGSVTLTPNAIAPTAVINSNVPANQSIKTVPSVFAPGLAAAGIETCLGSMSGGGSFLGTGFTLGGTLPDQGCSARLDARTLWSFGLRKAAVSRLCLSADIANAMPDVCGRYLPRPAYYAPAYTPGVAYASYQGGLMPGQVWLTNGHTGASQICNDYDSKHKHCRRWAR